MNGRFLLLITFTELNLFADGDNYSVLEKSNGKTELSLKGFRIPFFLKQGKMCNIGSLTGNLHSDPARDLKILQAQSVARTMLEHFRDTGRPLGTFEDGCSTL